MSSYSTRGRVGDVSSSAQGTGLLGVFPRHPHTTISVMWVPGYHIAALAQVGHVADAGSCI